MKYDFVTLPDRSGSGAEKFVNMRQMCPDVEKDIIPFSVADMDFLPPPELKKGMQDFLEHAVLGYTLPGDSYYEAVEDWMRRRHDLLVKREWMVDADNVIDAMRQMIQAFTKENDEILVFTPAYPAFLSSVRATGRKLSELPLQIEKGRYVIDFGQLEEACRKEEAAILLMCNPHNPTGRAWTKEELTKVADICLKHHVFIISDEIHWDLIMPDSTFVSMLSLDEKYQNNCAVSTSATKTFNMAAVKGATVVIVNEEIRKAFREYSEKTGIPGRGIFSYVACEIGYEKCEMWLDELLLVLARNRDILKQFFAQNIPEAVVFPLEATYLQWIDFRFLGLEEKELERFMAEKARCFFTEGYKFGKAGAGFERWNLACPEHVLLAGLERMKKAVNAFR